MISSMRQDDIIEELLKCSSQLENANLSEENEDKVIPIGGLLRVAEKFDYSNESRQYS